MSRRVDVLMITYQSAGYLDLSLPRLLSTLSGLDRVWLWHNGDDERTLDTLRPYLDDPRVERFHHSRENVRLNEPTNWLWRESEATYVSKVDDDCLVSPGWLEKFVEAHEDVPDLGVIGSWRHPEEDFRPEFASRKIRRLPGGHQVMLNLWVQGSGYLLRRSRASAAQGLRSRETFSGFCMRIAEQGAINGFYYPFVPEEHMDDPRSPHTLIRTDQDLADRLPLSAQANGIRTVTDWTAQLVDSAIVLQRAPYDLKYYRGWRAHWRNGRRRVQRILGRRATW